MIDRVCSVAMAVAVLVVAVAYARRLSRVGSARYPRIDRAGSSPLLGKGLMQMGYWAMGPMARACVALGIRANTVSWTSLALGAAAGFALASGHLGVGAGLSVGSSVCDALDGMVARATGTASASGEVLDAAVDRYVELFFFGGLAWTVRSDALALGLVWAAMSAAVMVSYATAKAEALQVVAPRGAMRRHERAVYLALGVALTPLAAAVRVRWALPFSSIDRAPLFLALALVAGVGNASALWRLYAVARTVRAVEGLRPEAAVRKTGGSQRFSGDAHAAAGDLLR